MSNRSLTLRAAGRVLLRVIAKSAAYGSVAVVAWWLAQHTDGTARTLLAVGLIPLALLALLVFRDKVREEAARIDTARKASHEN